MVPYTAVFVWMMLASMAVSEDVTVETDVGTIVGEISSTTFDGTTYKVKQFLGIPYAEPPTGERRFKKPVKKAAFAEPFVAKTVPPFCPQNNGYLEFFGMGMSVSRDVQSEDCLTLNIFTPENDVQGNNKRAVMVWFHCGFFEFETQNWYSAKVLAATQDIIYVTMDYRLSVLGFLSTGDGTLPGNNGLWDQRMAVQWVHDNIAKFGGDPEKVTIGGISSGSVSVIHQALYTGNRDLFKRVVAQSGSANNEGMFETKPLDKFKTISDKTGCTKDTHEATIFCLQDKPFTELMDEVSFDLVFRPVVDGEFIEHHPNDVFQNYSGNAWDILRTYGTYDIIFGLTSDEGALYLTPVDNLVKISGRQIPYGYTRDSFEAKIIPYVLKTTNYKDTVTLRHAIVNQYINWEDPYDSGKVRQGAIDFMSDTVFNVGVLKSAMMHAASGSTGRTYVYIFDHRSRISSSSINGANHGEDVVFSHGFPTGYVFYNFGINFTDPAAEFTAADIQLSKDMMEYWGNFIKTGNPNIGPNGMASSTWPEYDVENQSYIRLKGGRNEFPVEKRYAASRMNFWHRFVPDLYGQCDKTCEPCRTPVSSAARVRSAYLLITFLLAYVLGLY